MPSLTLARVRLLHLPSASLAMCALEPHLSALPLGPYPRSTPPPLHHHLSSTTAPQQIYISWLAKLPSTRVSPYYCTSQITRHLLLHLSRTICPFQLTWASNCIFPHPVLVRELVAFLLARLVKAHYSLLQRSQLEPCSGSSGSPTKSLSLACKS